MKVLLAVMGIASGVTACGGTVSKPDAHPSATPAEGGAETGGGGAPGTAPAPSGSTSAPLGGPGLEDPATDFGGAFLWRQGLGNWFVSVPPSMTTEAQGEVVDGAKVWSGLSGEGEWLDLWAQLNHPSGGAVDLGAYSGISFEARLQAVREVASTGGSPKGDLTIAFDAQGDIAKAAPERPFLVDETWQSYRLEFSFDAADFSRIASIDFFAHCAAPPFELQLRNVALQCEDTCR
jgi:hypothetical protein